MVLFKVKLFFIYVFLFILQSSSPCQVYPDNHIDSILKAGINYLIEQNYSKAGTAFHKLNKEYPDLPLGKIYLAAVQIAKSYDYGEEYNEIIIDSLLDDAADQSEELLDRDKDNIWNEYFFSLSKGYHAYFNALNENWISTFSDGVNALNAFDNVIKKDQNFYDALIAIGTFKYWKSRKTEFLNWLPGYIDERKEAIKMLEFVAKHQSYNRYLAINSLIWINIDRKKYTEAARLAESALRRYPGSRFFMWGLARAYEEINAEKSIMVYKNILNSLPAGLNHYNEIVLKYLMAQQYDKIGRKREALELCDEILSTKLNQKDYSKLEKRMRKVRELAANIKNNGKK